MFATTTHGSEDGHLTATLPRTATSVRFCGLTPENRLDIVTKGFAYETRELDLVRDVLDETAAEERAKLVHQHALALADAHATADLRVKAVEAKYQTAQAALQERCDQHAEDVRKAVDAATANLRAQLDAERQAKTDWMQQQGAREDALRDKVADEVRATVKEERQALEARLAAARARLEAIGDAEWARLEQRLTPDTTGKAFEQTVLAHVTTHLPRCTSNYTLPTDTSHVAHQGDAYLRCNGIGVILECKDHSYPVKTKEMEKAESNLLDHAQALVLVLVSARAGFGRSSVSDHELTVTRVPVNRPDATTPFKTMVCVPHFYKHAYDLASLIHSTTLMVREYHTLCPASMVQAIQLSTRQTELVARAREATRKTQRYANEAVQIQVQLAAVIDQLRRTLDPHETTPAPDETVTIDTVFCQWFANTYKAAEDGVPTLTANSVYREFKEASVYKELCEAERKKLTKKRGMAWLEGGGVDGVDVGSQVVRGYVRREAVVV